MNRCPITYENCGSARYSRKGIRKLSRLLDALNDFPYSADQQRKEAALRVSKLSIQGIQPKLSTRLNIKNAVFEIIDRGGRYIVKPQHDVYPELPENEDLSMRLASAINISVPFHGLVYCKDGTFSYFIRRFDRTGKSGKLATEDFAQITGRDRETKYDFSMERLVAVLDVCTFPAVERVRLFRRCIFNFLIGNEDMHLKNFSLITRDSKTELSPASDYLSTTVAFLLLGKDEKEIEEIALPLKGKKRNLTGSAWIDYFGRERLGLNPKVVTGELSRFTNNFDRWTSLIQNSFLSDTAKDLYLKLISNRRSILSLNAG